MALARVNTPKEMEPGLNGIFGFEYGRYENEHLFIFDVEKSSRAFEEEVLFSGFAGAKAKSEGGPVDYDEAQELWTARYNHETIALAFAITEEAMEDNLYESIAQRLTRALARSMAHTKQVKAADVLNRAFNTSFVGGDGVTLLNTAHPLGNNQTFANKPTTDLDLSELALENMYIDVAGFVDERGIPVVCQPRRLIIPRQEIFTAERLLKSDKRSGTADNDLNAFKTVGVLPDGYSVNHRLTDPDAWFVKTDCPDGMKMFERVKVQNKMEGDFETGNVRYKARERYSYGWSNPRGMYGSSGA